MAIVANTRSIIKGKAGRTHEGYFGAMLARYVGNLVRISRYDHSGNPGYGEGVLNRPREQRFAGQRPDIFARQPLRPAARKYEGNRSQLNNSAFSI